MVLFQGIARGHSARRKKLIQIQLSIFRDLGIKGWRRAGFAQVAINDGDRNDEGSGNDSGRFSG
jgi:hypothetical protein